MMRKLAVVGTVTGVLLTASVAGAQSSGSGLRAEGGVHLQRGSARTGPGVHAEQGHLDNANPNVSVSTTGSNLSLLWGNNSVFGTAGASGPSAFRAAETRRSTRPRGSASTTSLIPNLTIGGDLFVFFTLGGSTTTTTGATSRTARQSFRPTRSGSRRGSATSSGSARCSRSGCAVASRTTTPERACRTASCTNQNDTTSLNLFGLDIDPQLVISPSPHFAFTAGPAIDIGFAGSASATAPGGGPNGNCNSTTTTSGGYSSYNIGLTGGLIGWF